jgi:hypothetical protein
MFDFLRYDKPFYAIALPAGFWICCLEWGNRSAFVIEVQCELLFEKGLSLSALSHPMVLAPFAGQLFPRLHRL